MICKCGKESTPKETYPEYLNWKCIHCGKINPFNSVPRVIWNTDPGTVKRSKS
jgi:hypothetical protein